MTVRAAGPPPRRPPEPPLRLPPGPARSRFGREVDLPNGFAAQLRSVCAAVDDSDEERDAAARDWWPLSLRWALDGEVPARPALVARPSDAGQVAAVLGLCQGAKVPVTASGGRSGVLGGCIPAFGGVALDLTALAGIVAVDHTSLVVDVRAGTFGSDFEDALRVEYGLTLGHWPQSIGVSTVGGWLACRSAGQYSTRYGKIEDMVVALEVALADGRLVRTGWAAPRAATGPDLTQIFVGSEGTLGVITEARLRAHVLPATERRAAWGFTDFAQGLDACRRIMRRGATPAVLRLYDAVESERSFDVAGRAVLVVLDEGDPGLVDATMAVVAEECSTGSPLDGGLVTRWFEHRNETPSLDALLRSGLIVDTIEVAASWAALPTVYRSASDGLRAVEDTVVASAHQSHAYRDGACLYFTFAGRPSPGEAENYYCRAWQAVMAATVANGGAISHHHGIGINRGQELAGALGPTFEVLPRSRRPSTLGASSTRASWACPAHSGPLLGPRAAWARSPLSTNWSFDTIAAAPYLDTIICRGGLRYGVRDFSSGVHAGVSAGG